MRSLRYVLFSLFLLPLESWAGDLFAWDGDQKPIIDPKAPTIYMIRHGEKPPKARDGSDPPGLSAEGITRAEGLVQTFGRDSKYNIGFIIAEHFKKTGERNRSYNTVAPLSTSLNLKIHSKIHRNDSSGVVDLIQKYSHSHSHKKNPGNILICWEHERMSDIAAEIGVTQYANESGWEDYLVVYPWWRFDLIWVIPPPWTEIVRVDGEGIPRLDDGKVPLPPSSAILGRGVSLGLGVLVGVHIFYLLLFC